jgi:hypothetical protein
MDPPAATPTATAATAGGAAAATGVYGAAMASIANPACIPGTPEFAAKKADMDALLQRFWNRVVELEDAGVSNRGIFRVQA